MSDAPVIYLIAGEPSGDLLGARLMKSLQEKLADSGVEFIGIGGPEMTSGGLTSLFAMSELSVMGLAEILPHLPHFIRRINQCVGDIKARQPAVLVTIDSPGFCFRVARRLRAQGIPLVHYVAPSVWAWRPGRAAKVAGFLDHLLALLPFEPPYFERVGLATTFVGHPVVEGGAGDGDGAAFRRRHGIGDSDILLSVLPGSRNSEISRLLPVFGETVSLLAIAHPGLRVVVPTVAALHDKVIRATQNWPGGVIVVAGTDEKFDAFAASNLALAASGTVALELAMSGTPHVIAYKVHALTAWVAGKLIKTPYVNLINIILDRPVVPELIQQDCRADLLAAALGDLLGDKSLAQRQIAAANEALDQLGRGGEPPSDRAADVIISIINQHKGQRS